MANYERYAGRTPFFERKVFCGRRIFQHEFERKGQTMYGMGRVATVITKRPLPSWQKLSENGQTHKIYIPENGVRYLTINDELTADAGG